MTHNPAVEPPSHLPGGGARAIGIAGPTASGKSALALAAAQRWPVELISVDSAQVYQGMDIGTAKPSAAERAAVPHHLIDLLPPTRAYSAADFVADARRLVADINARGRTALLVGGTMLYFKALADGLDDLPPADAAVRAALDARAAAEGWPALHADLARVDPVTAARLPPGDAQRIQRALEVWQRTGRPLSSFHGGARDAGLAVPLLALEPADRAWLHARIAQRFDAMLDAGLLTEVQQPACPRGPAVHAAVHALRGLPPGLGGAGRGRCPGHPLQPGTAAWAQLRAQGIAATRQLAKRQLTWLRGMQRTVVACDAPDADAQGLAALAGLMAAPAGTAGAPAA